MQNHIYLLERRRDEIKKGRGCRHNYVEERASYEFLLFPSYSHPSSLLTSHHYCTNVEPASSTFSSPHHFPSPLSNFFFRFSSSIPMPILAFSPLSSSPLSLSLPLPRAQKRTFPSRFRFLFRGHNQRRIERSGKGRGR